MDYMVELTKTITLPGKTFKAWKKGEYGFSILVTLILPPGSEGIKREVIIRLILKQNGLVGQHTILRFKTKSEVTLITMGVSPDLAASLINLGGSASMGARMVKVHQKKDELEDKKVKDEVVEEIKDEVDEETKNEAKVEETELEDYEDGVDDLGK